MKHEIEMRLRLSKDRLETYKEHLNFLKSTGRPFIILGCGALLVEIIIFTLPKFKINGFNIFSIALLTAVMYDYIKSHFGRKLDVIHDINTVTQEIERLEALMEDITNEKGY